MTSYRHEIKLTQNGFEDLKANITSLAKNKPESWWYGHALLREINESESNVIIVDELQYGLVRDAIDPIDILEMNYEMASTNSWHMKQDIVIKYQS